jgi:hypothetical protein
VLNSDIGIVSRGYAYPEDPRLSDGVQPVLLCQMAELFPTIRQDSFHVFIIGHTRLLSLALADALGSLAMRQCAPCAQYSQSIPSVLILYTT